jgi:hypothetical protein
MTLRWGRIFSGSSGRRNRCWKSFLDIIALGTAAMSDVAQWVSFISFISLCGSAGVIFETFSGSDEGGRF